MPVASHNPATLALPSSAPVLEYICLFTHDLKRKQKRWQDGRLKYHTFNKRIMVYDGRGNFIGDMHWREDWEFGEGEEFNLERGAVIVQVSECVASVQQDLTELLEKRVKEIEQRHARSPAVAYSPAPPPRPPVVAQQQTPSAVQAQYRQRHLSDLFNTPRGPPGRAVIPKTSPYEERMAAQASSSQDENQPPPKRRKRDVSPPSKAGYAQNLFGTALTLSSWSSSAPLRSQPMHAPVKASRVWSERSKPRQPTTFRQADVDNVARAEESLRAGNGHRTAHSASEKPAENDHVVPMDDAPKATLRIKSRQKRGLLMIANRATSTKSPSPRDTPEAESTRDTREESSNRGASAKPAQGSPAPVTSDAESEKRNMRTSRKRQSKDTDGDIEMAESMPVPTTILVRDESAEPPEDSDEDFPDEPRTHDKKQAPKKTTKSRVSRTREVDGSDTGPRLASLGRRSVKSKEIIGSFRTRPPQLSREPSISRPASREGPTDTVDADTANKSAPCEDSDDDFPMPVPRSRRLNNPATRGRKAAKKSDAAGSVPQSIIPAIPGGAVQSSKQVEEPKAARPGSAREGQAGKRLPGFAKANGGPWSTEAFDLLGCMRPE
ncbi:hypothetical protein CTRI78_v000130 [Colletotrichum trifolii]|uniref:5'-3' DNA helicase ZGRF1-like N-terminal domain-containing protein n=1 Tax=Colletotrichum trifolii TaxID=5466 RepID=A0A4R8RWN7_COLTR|nr:hypothetical protein CTRI78_v000130 [Colletotrichum trifolii]